MACSGQFSFRTDAHKQDLIHFYLDSCTFFIHVHYTSPYIDRNPFTLGMLSIAATYIQPELSFFEIARHI